MAEGKVKEGKVKVVVVTRQAGFMSGGDCGITRPRPRPHGQLQWKRLPGHEAVRQFPQAIRPLERTTRRTLLGDRVQCCCQPQPGNGERRRRKPTSFPSMLEKRP